MFKNLIDLTNINTMLSNNFVRKISQMANQMINNRLQQISLIMHNLKI